MAIRLAISALSMGSLGVTLAQMTDDAVCMSLCGLIVDDTKRCNLAVAVKGVCERLFFNTDSKLVYEHGIIPDYRGVTVAEALAEVRAKDDNCYAMCYNDSACRKAGSHCSENGVCKNLFWNRYDRRDVSTYMLLTNKNEDQVNLDSPVMCDPVSGKEPEVHDYPGVVDMCTAVCSLTHTDDECSRVYRVGYECYRLFWADSQKQATVFTAERVNGQYPPMNVQDAFDMLMATNNSCENLCRMHPTCKLAAEVSNCNEVNRSCRGLFYYSGTVLKNDMKVCFGPSCKEASPVTCRLPNDPVNFLNKPAMMLANGDAAATRTKSFELVTSASMMVAPIVLAVWMH